MKPTLFFGELMARFSPPGALRFGQAMPGVMDVTFAGAEANAAVAFTRLGGAARWVSAMPHGPLAEAALALLRGVGVGLEHVERRDSGRLGIYFVEAGAGPRGGNVIYDREGSTFAQVGAEAYRWRTIVEGATWFHTSGVSGGVSVAAAEALLAGVQAARDAGLTVSCDLNFRRKLWRWKAGVPAENLFQQTMAAVLALTDVIIGNPQDLATVLGEPRSDDGGAGGGAGCEALAERAARRFPQAKYIAITLRRCHSASRHDWGALLYSVNGQCSYWSPQAQSRYTPFEIDPIIDRVGTGDVFAGAMILALQSKPTEPQEALDFATAASCLAHTECGDFFQGTRAEVEALLRGESGGQVSR